MQCFKCGAALSDSAAFCTNCGAKLNGNKQPSESVPQTPTEQQTPPIQQTQPTAPGQPQQYYQSQQPWQPIPAQQTPPPIPPQQTAPQQQPFYTQQPASPQQQIPMQQFAQPIYQASVIPQQPAAVKPKKNLALPVVCISIAVVAVVALIIVLILTMGGKNNDDSNKDGSTTRDYSSIITTIPEIEPSVETEVPETTVTEPAVTTSPEVTEATTAAETVSSSEAQTTPPVVSGTVSIRSTISGNTFKSNLFKIQAELDDDWEFGDDSVIAKLNGMAGTSDADFEKAIKENNVFYDTLATKSTGSNFIIAMPNTDMLGSIALSEKTYAEATLEGIKGIDSSAAVSTITFAGKTHQAIKVTNDSMGTSFKQCLVFVKSGQNICMITFTCFTDEELDEVMGWFTSLE